MVLETIGTFAVCSTALALFMRGFFHAGGLVGMFVEDMKAMSTRPKAPPPRPAPPPEDPWAAYCRKAEAAEQALFLETGMWWLDPNRWGEDPDWRDRIPKAIQPVPRTSKNTRRMCPTCHTWDQVRVMGEHGGQANAWHCVRCDEEFTRATLTSRKPIDEMKNVQRQMRDLDAGFLSPAELRPPVVDHIVKLDNGDELVHYSQTFGIGAGVKWRNPKATMRSVMALPCGCPAVSTAIEKHGPLKDGTRWVRCGQCEKWWEPASNSESGRVLAEGARVRNPGHMTPTTLEAWGKMVNRPERNHGACPSRLCQMPVDKRDGMYYCTSPDCDHFYKGWK